MPFDYEYDWEAAPNIFYIQPYSLDMHYGREINKHIEPLPDDAWIVLQDYDILYLTPDFGRVIHNVIVEHGDDTDLFTCQTNRLGNPKRCYNGEFSRERDIAYHMRIARSLQRQHGTECEEVKDRIVAGMFMLFPKRVWLENKFDDRPIIDTEDNKMTSFDVRWTAKIKGSIKKILGLYVWHSYRLDRQHHSDFQHLIKE